jgi:hypothetical protein
MPAVEGEIRADVEIVVAGTAKAPRRARPRVSARRAPRPGNSRSRPKCERIARVEDVIDGFAAEKFVQAVELLQRLGVLGAPAQAIVEEGRETLGMEHLGRAEGAGRQRQMHVAEMEDAETHRGAV